MLINSKEQISREKKKYNILNYIMIACPMFELLAALKIHSHTVSTEGKGKKMIPIKHYANRSWWLTPGA